MRVDQIMTRNVRGAHVGNNLDTAARIMWENNCGCVPVIDQDQKAVGMLTDRDVCMAALTQGRLLTEIPISIAMSKPLWSCRPEDDLAAAEQIMRSHQVHRLPVVDDKGRLLGILSLSDIAREAMREEKQKGGRRDIAYAEIGRTLGSISELYGPTAARV